MALDASNGIEETCHRIDVSIEAIKIESVKG